MKLTFAKGAALKDPTRLFNSSLDGNVRRAIDIGEGQAVNEAAFKALVREAVALNSARPSKAAKAAKKAAPTPPKKTAAKPATKTAAKPSKKAMAKPAKKAKR